MSARDLIWSFVDRICPPPVGDGAPGSSVEDFTLLDERRKPEPTPERKYARVTAWLRGKIVASGDLEVLAQYRSPMHRILFRPYKQNGDHLSYTATFFWLDGAWASVYFEDAEDLNTILCGSLARLLNWPTPEAI